MGVIWDILIMKYGSTIIISSALVYKYMEYPNIDPGMIAIAPRSSNADLCREMPNSVPISG